MLYIRKFLWSFFALVFGFLAPLGIFYFLNMIAPHQTADVFYGKNPKVEEQAAEEPVKKTEKSSGKVSMIFVGDIMMARGVENSVLANASGDFSFIFKNAGFIKDADISFANLEGPASDKGEDSGSIYSFRFNPKSLGAIKKAGFDILSVANNHAGDWGRIAFEDSLKRLEKEGIIEIGGGFDAGDSTEVKIIEKNGIKVGFLGFSDVGPNWLKAGEKLSGISIAGNDLGPLVRKAAGECDVLVVSFHFGDEYEKAADDRQKHLARLAVDNGAKIVVGHHPHVTEEVERYKGAIIAYSLGNFVFDQNFSDDTMAGMALEVNMEGKNITSANPKKIKISKSFQPSPVD